MNELIKNVIAFKKQQNDLIFEEICNNFKKTINYFKMKVIKEYRDDFCQELVIKLFNCILIFQIEDLIKIKTIKVEDIIKMQKNNKYVKSFNDSYIKKLNIENICLVKNIYEYFDEMNLFFNENQFKRYVNTSFKNFLIQFNKKINKHLKESLYILNEQIDDGIEYIDLIVDYQSQNETMYFDINLLEKKDIAFLENFFENGILLKGTDVARKLGVTQQAVSIRLKRIKMKYVSKYNESI